MSLLWRFLDWRREALLFAVTLLEVCWLYPWLAFLLLLAAGQTAVVPFWGMWLWLLAATLWLRLLNNLSLTTQRQQLLVLGAALLSILLVIKLQLYPAFPLLSLRWIGQLFSDVRAEGMAIPPQALLFLLGLFLWWRGIRLAQGSLSWLTVSVRFRLGVVAWMLYLIVAAFGGLPFYTPLLLGFFYFGLVAIALARILDLQQMRGGIRAPFGSAWLVILIGSTALVVLLGVFTSELVSLQNIRGLFAALRPLTKPLGEALLTVLMFIVYVLFTLLSYVVRWVRRSLGDPEEVELQLPQFDELDKFREAFESPSLMAWARIGRDVLLVALLVLGLLAVVLAVRRELRRREAARNLTRESVWSSEDFLDELTDLLRGGWRRLREGVDDLARRLGERYSLLSIRKIYASLNLLAAEQGYPRREAETPYEYIGTLQQAWPSQTADIETVTAAYVRAHYGERGDDEETMQQVRAAWERLRAVPPVPHPKPPPTTTGE